MIPAILALASTRWVQYLIGSIALVAGLWFGIINPYNNYVSEKKVAAALVKERAETAPRIKLLQDGLAKERAKILAIETESARIKAERDAVIATKTKELQNALGREKILNQNLVALRSANSEFDRLLNAATANNDSAIGASASSRLKRLSGVHQQCQRALREANDDTTDALRILGEALATIDALKQ